MHFSVRSFCFDTKEMKIQQRNKRRENLLKTAIKNSINTSESDRLKEASRQALQYWVDQFMGNNGMADYDNSIKNSMNDFFEYMKLKMDKETVPFYKQIDVVPLNKLMELYPTNVHIQPGQRVASPDVDDVDVVSANDKLIIIMFLIPHAKSLEIVPSVVGGNTTSSSGNETS